MNLEEIDEVESTFALPTNCVNQMQGKTLWDMISDGRKT